MIFVDVSSLVAGTIRYVRLELNKYNGTRYSKSEQDDYSGKFCEEAQLLGVITHLVRLKLKS